MCIGWQVKIDMSGQDNDCLQLHNVKMKKTIYEAKTEHISENLQVMPCTVKQSKIFFSKMVKLDEKESGTKNE